MRKPSGASTLRLLAPFMRTYLAVIPMDAHLLPTLPPECLLQSMRNHQHHPRHVRLDIGVSMADENPPILPSPPSNLRRVEPSPMARPHDATPAYNATQSVKYFGACYPHPDRTAHSRTRIILVDPASSYMLVSKIKPCMSKYKLYSIVKPQKAQYNSYYLFDYNNSYLDNCGNSRANTCKRRDTSQ